MASSSTGCSGALDSLLLGFGGAPAPMLKPTAEADAARVAEIVSSFLDLSLASGGCRGERGDGELRRQKEALWVVVRSEHGGGASIGGWLVAPARYTPRWTRGPDL